jgi:hypothetical protein
MTDNVTPIFLLSLPRSGSTLLQRILSSHSQIATVSEPWLMLPFLYALRGEGAVAEYGHSYLASAVNDFCENLPQGRADYLREVGETALRLYGKAAGGGVRYFLDKTPRYHLICSELVEIFPGAKFVIMWRNPLAVLSSILDTFHRGKWIPRRYEIDLYGGLESLVDLSRSNPERIHTLRYEDVVLDTDTALAGICEYLDLEVEPGMAAGLASKQLEGQMGDHGPGVVEDGVSTSSLQKWQRVLSSPVRTRYAGRYLEWIGRERLEHMGYDLGELREELKEVPIGLGKLVPDLLRSLRSLIDRSYSAWT